MNGPRRILFVDDEERVLEGLRDRLRRYARRWSMHFVAGGPAALAVLEGETFDVVVTDLRMPDVDGFELLDRVRKLHPAAVRLVLSGDPRRETTLRAVPHAHRILVKPCRREELEAALESACELGGLLADPALRETIGKICDLPPLPQNALRLEAALAEEGACAVHVASIVSSDIALSAQVLKHANSAAFANGRLVTSVGDAVARLGTEVIRTIVISDGVLGRREIPAVLRKFAVELHHHASVVARVAIALTRSAELQRDVFSAAMLHDIGSLVLALEQPILEAEPSSVLRIPSPHGGYHIPDHARVGAYLLGLWGLPASVLEAVAHHHGGDDVEAGPAARIVVKAEEIVGTMTGGKRPTEDDARRMIRAAKEMADATVEC